MPSRSSWKVSCFQTTLIFPFHEKALCPWAYLDTLRISSSKQLKRTMQPVKAVSRVAAISGLDLSSISGSCFDKIRAWIWDSEALITATSEEIATMFLGAS